MTKPPIAVLHIPHASLEIPADLRGSILLNDQDLERELLNMTDRFTDELFAIEDSLAAFIVFPVSRLVVDPERFTDDTVEPMAAVGMGVVYTDTSMRTPLRHRLAPAEREELLTRFYHPHHERLSSAVEAALSTHGRALVFDCHSFASVALPYEFDQTSDRLDICLGTDFFHTPKSLVPEAQQLFAAAGFSVDLNRPFAGALVPERHYHRDPRVAALMIEVNRRLYMDEQNGLRLAAYADVQRELSRILGVLIEQSQEHP